MENSSESLGMYFLEELSVLGYKVGLAVRTLCAPACVELHTTTIPIYMR